MGLLSNGTPLVWQEAKKYSNHVREQGITQLLNLFKKEATRDGDPLLWGDELEYMIATTRQQAKDRDGAAVEVVLDLKAAEILMKLQQLERHDLQFDSSWKPEYARYMLEGTPAKPFDASIESVLQVENNMLKRRQVVESMLYQNQMLLTVTNFPILGSTQCRFLEPDSQPRPSTSVNGSFFIPDEAIAPHARFPTLTKNIRERRGSKVVINVPIYHDSNTASPFMEPYHDPSDSQYVVGAKVDHIVMDAMCFGMGCSCLQITFQASNIDEARKMYDQLAVLTPIMLALTAGTPIFRGLLADVDCRWNVISASVDDRTDQERGLKQNEPADDTSYRLQKSRYDSISTYISQTADLPDSFNDLPFAQNKAVFKRLHEDEMFDERLARHFAHLFTRDPLVIFAELLNVNNNESTDHFENIQSTNWQTMRFKPPPLNSGIGWRVEFRSMEIHLTEFENAAFACFIMLLYRSILHFNVNMYMPLSLVDVNMQRAQLRNAVMDLNFHFRQQINFPRPTNNNSHGEMSVDEIINGRGDGELFPGMIPLVRAYLATQTISVDAMDKIESYLSLISKRASGELITTASYIRKFVHSHKDYKQDSVISSSINADLLHHLDDITHGRSQPSEFMP